MALLPREPVLFMEGLQQALQSGARIFVEIGPSATLLALVNDVAESTDSSIAAFSVLDRSRRRRADRTGGRHGACERRTAR